MICNIGCTEDAAHSLSLNRMPKGIRRVFNMETYELEFPLKHAKYVIPDIEYEKKRNRIMAYNHPFISYMRRWQGTWARITSDGIGVWLKRQISPGDSKKVKNEN